MDKTNEIFEQMVSKDVLSDVVCHWSVLSMIICFKGEYFVSMVNFFGILNDDGNSELLFLLLFFDLFIYLATHCSCRGKDRQLFYGNC
ncbi:hypothetical protein PanWU01x14_052990 [Parasponia andersonii]|uniref:Transmembrane protein n=1 Tax=Parasponia andersonii TaxID=3476 RepID=A0A2P5DLB3_PARAD|nr:hypothetical protein PanWU01x14_052990 [Parasponia andersonii]